MPSLEGRKILLKVVAQGNPSYAMSVFNLPLGILKAPLGIGKAITSEISVSILFIF